MKSDYHENMRSITDDEWEKLRKRLSRSAFRSRFHLGGKEREYALEKGREEIERHADSFIRARLAPGNIPNDGKQTPMKGYPIFKAQHATGCCCRGCLEKWHHIPKGRALEEAEIEYIADVIMRWIDDEMKGYSPQQPLLF